MRVTASSMRDMGTAPLRTSWMVLSMNWRHSAGTMKTSMPAFNAWAQRKLLQPVTWPMPFQSDTTSPSKPIFPFRTSVMR